jgi:hypothetical protein
MSGPQSLMSGSQEQMPGRQDQQIQHLRNACGCKSGMVMMLVCLAGYVAYELRAMSSAGLMQRMLTGLGIALAGAVVGKLAGLLWAHARLVRLLRLQARANSQGGKWLLSLTLTPPPPPSR